MAPEPGGSRPELEQRVDQLDERFDRLVALLASALVIRFEPPNEQETP
jgi:hypothetical protein